MRYNKIFAANFCILFRYFIEIAITESLHRFSEFNNTILL